MSFSLVRAEIAKRESLSRDVNSARAQLESIRARFSVNSQEIQKKETRIQGIFASYNLKYPIG